jgi:hypothetical protein
VRPAHEAGLYADMCRTRWRGAATSPGCDRGTELGVVGATVGWQRHHLDHRWGRAVECQGEVTDERWSHALLKSVMGRRGRGTPHGGGVMQSDEKCPRYIYFMIGQL